MESSNQEENEYRNMSNEPVNDDNDTPLSDKNALNVIFYILNIIITYGIGVAGWFGAGSNADLSAKYQTIVTPKSTAFSIWAVIFASQAIFVVAQLLPEYRAHPMVASGVGYHYIAVCVFQIGWTFVFSFELIPISMCLMGALWITLLLILFSQYQTTSDGTPEEFWLLCFPFSVHAGWITAAAFVNANVVVVWSMESEAIQLLIGIISLVLLYIISVCALYVTETPNYTVAIVLSWSNFWIFSELWSKQGRIVNIFGETVVNRVAFAALSVSVIILIQAFVKFKGKRSGVNNATDLEA
mmetsp:Transcript_41192/g.80612  ORF Transcript_41192/g.80612 Transcript_41192/m.80612 type:complete len:299 (-) Transcript_41192:263-1159(-)